MCPLIVSGRLDAENVQDRGDEVDRVVVLLADLPARLRAGGPRDDAGVAGSAVVLVALPHLERRVEGHGPAGRVVVIGLRAAEVVDLGEVRGEVVGHAVGELHLVDRAVGAALAACAVVGYDHDQRVVELLGPLEVVEEAADVVVGVGEKACVHLGHAAEELFLVVVQRVPGPDGVELGERLTVRARPRLRRADRVERGQLGVGRHDAELLLPRQCLLAHRLVPHVEASLELLDPFGGRVMGGVAGARRVTTSRNPATARMPFRTGCSSS